jgi:hypothetical protein
MRKHFIYALVAVLFLLAAQERSAQPSQTNAQNKIENTAQQVSTPINSPSPQIDNSAKPESEGERKEREAKEEHFKSEQLRQNWIMVWATVLIAILTVVALILNVVFGTVSYKQWETAKTAANAAEKSANAAEESVHMMTRSERPEITLALKIGDLAVDHPTEMEFDVFNAGKTTAYNFGIHISCEIKAVPFGGVLDYGKPNPAAAEPIRPQKHKFIHTMPWLFPLDIQLLDDIQNERAMFFIYGVMWYEDSAGNKYEEPFCRRYAHRSPNDPAECSESIRKQMRE